MVAPSNFWEALPIDDSVFALANITPAKPDDATTLLSLPVEVLELIVEYCNTRSLFPLLQTNQTLYNVVLRRLYATIHLHIDYCSKGPSPKPSEVTKLCRLNQHQVNVLRALTQRRQHLGFLRQLHIVKLQWSQTGIVDHLHQLFHYALDGAVSLQHLTFANCDPIPDTAYNGVVIRSTLKHISIPNLQKNLISAIPLSAHLHSLCITSQCAPLGELQELGEKWGSSLRHFRCIIHVPTGDPDLSFETIDEFASKFLHLNTLRYGYCECGSNREVPIESHCRMISQLPQLTSVTLEDHRSRVGYNKDEEREAIESFCRVNNRLESISFGYLNPWDKYQETVWKAAPPSVIERSRDVRGDACIWTPDPFDWEGWHFWLTTFGLPSATQRAMMDRWPGATIPSIGQLVLVYLSEISTLDIDFERHLFQIVNNGKVHYQTSRD